MNAIVLILSSLLLCPQLPEPNFADTEVSTNIPIVVDSACTDDFTISFSLFATPTNNLEVAVGRDANCDGSLSLDETAIAFGYDCGRWFERNTRAGEIVFDEVSVGSSLQRTRVFVGDELDERWNLVKIIRRGACLPQDEVSYTLHSHFGTLFIIR